MKKGRLVIVLRMFMGNKRPMGIVIIEIRGQIRFVQSRTLEVRCSAFDNIITRNLPALTSPFVKSIDLLNQN